MLSNIWQEFHILNKQQTFKLNETVHKYNYNIEYRIYTWINRELLTGINSNHCMHDDIYAVYIQYTRTSIAHYYVIQHELNHAAINSVPPVQIVHSKFWLVWVTEARVYNIIYDIYSRCQCHGKITRWNSGINYNH